MESYVLFEIKQLQNTIVRTICTDMKQHNITSPPTLIQAEIIGYLIQNKEKNVYQRELESVFKLRRSTISGILQTMEKKNIIERVDNQNDGRTKKIILTEKAFLQQEIALNYLKQLEQNITKDITVEELELFRQVVQKMKHNLEIN